MSASIAKIRKEWDEPVRVLHKERTLGDQEDVNARIEKNEGVAEDLLVDIYRALRVDTPEQSRRAPEAGNVADEVGEAGDSRLRNMRRKVMMIRSIASLETAVNPAMAEIAKEVRRRTEQALRNPHLYEKATVW